MRRPEGAKVIVVIAKRGKFFAQFAGAHVSIVVNHHGRLAGRAGKWPGDGLLKVLMLRAVVGGDCSHVSNILDETLAGIVFSKHAIAVATGQIGNVGVDSWQSCGRYLLDLVTNQGLAANDIKVLSVKPKLLPHVFREHLDLGIVLGTD